MNTSISQQQLNKLCKECDVEYMQHIFNAELITIATHIIHQCAQLADNNKLGVGYPTMGYAITNYYGILPRYQQTVQQVL